MKIGIDLDEVLADFLSALIEYHNFTYHTKLKRDQFSVYKFWKIWGGTRNEAIQKVYDFHKTPFFENIQSFSEAKKAVSILKNNHKLFIVTSRQNDVQDKTLKWINQHFPNTFEGVYFANHFSQNGDSQTKNQICNKLKIDVLIEDSIEYASECLSPQRKIFLLDSPWNQNSKLPQNIHRVSSWNEILKLIQELNSKK